VRARPLFWICLGTLFWTSVSPGQDVADGNPYGRWKNGISSEPGFFPIAVWLQHPSRAARYQALGINLYIGLWKGPTEAQLRALEKARMKVICAQNAVGLKPEYRETIVGWMHGDEPDNARWLGKGKGYGPPVPPERIVADYRKLRANDPTRPVILNLGQGVAWDGWRGRGVRTNHPEDYPEYVRGSDIVSFDIYPACHPRPEIAGKLWYVPRGVARLREWTKRKKPVWCCIECTHINNPKAKATPKQVKAEVWMAITHGAQGLIYFSHQFKPKFIEAGMLADRTMAEAIGRINREIHELAPVINTPTRERGVTLVNRKKIPIHTMVKRPGKGGAVHVFAVAMRPGEWEARFKVKGIPGRARVTVLGEDRVLEARGGVFEDRFAGWDVHLYRIERK